MSENASNLRLNGPRSVSGASLDVLVEELYNCFMRLNRPGFEHTFYTDDVKYVFKYNPDIWGFKRAESFDMDIMENPINDMLDEVLEPVLSKLNPFKHYTMEIVNDTTIVFKVKE